MNPTPIKLLSPAKNLEVGIAAINHGADAVYIGGPAFGAREKAGNSIKDIEQLCRHASLFDAKVYVTLNTLLYENEKEEARRLAWDCWNAGVDALIIQDLSLLELDLPPVPLHASTQCDNLTVERVQELERLGFEQVVLGRELSIDQIKEIRRQTTVPLEFFVHGSLCVSHSGQCYLSQHIGNRSANRGACAQPCRLPWDLLEEDTSLRAERSEAKQSTRTLIKGKHLLCLKDLNNSANLEELLDAGITCFKIEGRLKDADYVKNITAFYRQRLDAIFERRPEYVQASQGHCTYNFEVNPEKSFNRGFTDYFIHGRQPNIGSPFTPKSMGEYIGEVKWCNSVQMELLTDKILHNGDGLCFLNQDEELIGIRADVVNGNKVSCNRPHGAQRGSKIYRNYDIEWQRQVEASTGNRKIDIDLVLEDVPEGYRLTAMRHCEERSDEAIQLDPGKASSGWIASAKGLAMTIATPKITANNPEKALENIRRKALQWGDTIYNPVSLEIRFSQPYLIPASVIGEMKRGLLAQIEASTSLRGALATKQSTCRRTNNYHPTCGLLRSFLPRNDEQLSTLNSKLSTLMTCHHCIRYANGMCPKITGKPVGPLFIRNGENTFRLEFDCKNCLMYVCTLD